MRKRKIMKNEINNEEIYRKRILFLDNFINHIYILLRQYNKIKIRKMNSTLTKYSYCSSFMITYIDKENIA